MASVRYLGHVVSQEGVHPDPDKLKAVRDYPTPTNVRAVRAFVGLCGYYRRFVKNFGSIARPLTNLTKDGVKWCWGQPEEAAFRRLQETLLTAPVLAFPVEGAPYELHTDASRQGLGAELTQIVKGEERVLSYLSRGLSVQEEKYHTTDLECLAVVWAIQQSRPYLFGQKFTVVTDHAALKLLMITTHAVGSRLARYAMELQEHNMIIRHRPGLANNNADGLSRNPVGRPTSETDIALFPPEKTGAFVLAGVENGLTPHHLRQRQMEDAFWGPILRFLVDPTNPTLQSVSKKAAAYEVVDGVLYRKVYGEEKPRRIAVPVTMRTWVQQHCHDDPLSGHLAIDKTGEKVRHRFFWPKMTTHIYDYVTSCHACQLNKPGNQLPGGHLGTIPVGRRFEMVGIDIVGPMPRTREGNRYILVATDYATRYAIVEPCADKSSATVAKFIANRLIGQFGTPAKLLSDKGAEFLSRSVSRLLQMQGMAHLRTSGYHPQCNGLTERFNGTLGRMLRMFVEPEGYNNWDNFVFSNVKAYNSAKHATTGFSPHFLMFGEEPLAPLDIALPQSSQPVQDLQQWWNHLVNSREFAKLRIGAAHDKEAERYNRTHHDVRLKPGELVTLQQRVRHGKLSPRATGPYVVKKVVSPVDYILEPQKGGKEILTHISHLRPYIQRSPSWEDIASMPEPLSIPASTQSISSSTTQQRPNEYPPNRHSSSASSDPDARHCICQTQDDGRTAMIRCDECNIWYHGTCLRLPTRTLWALSGPTTKWNCPACIRSLTTLRRQRTQRAALQSTARGLGADAGARRSRCSSIASSELSQQTAHTAPAVTQPGYNLRSKRHQHISPGGSEKVASVCPTGLP